MNENGPSRVLALAACLLAYLAFSISGAASGPLSVVSEYYEHLLSGADVTNSTTIFSDAESRIFMSLLEGDAPARDASPSDVSQAVWSYLRRHESMFISPGIPSNQTVDRSGKWYVFENPPPGDIYTEGCLSIVLVMPVEGASRVVKQVRFPLQKERGEWKINPVRIAVNGIGFNFENGARTQDLYRVLGILPPTPP